ncbi:quercetin dioxygenase-like cupin family protein [Micromonospora sp. H404/HB375]|nr:quercetin dioxygenase-like cupin family protein [Micromonospora sp. H404/HB375]
MYPDWIEALPRAAVNFPGAEGRLMSSPQGQVVLWSFADGGTVPPHRHGPQVGLVLSGAVHLTVEETTTTHRPGAFFVIDDQQEHGATLDPGTHVIEIFAETDRHRAVESLEQASAG